MTEEIITPEYQEDAFDTFVPDKQIEKFLDTFDEAGLIRRGKATGHGQIRNEKGEWVSGDVTFETIELCEFEELQDTWTARYQHKGVGQGKGGGGYRAT